MKLTNLSFCSSRCFSPEIRIPQQDSGHEENGSSMARIVHNMNPKILWRKNKKKQKKKKEKRHQQLKVGNLKGVTLEELFPKSPTVGKDEEDYDLKHGSGSACVSHDSGEYSAVSLEELLNSSDCNTSMGTESVSISDARDLSASLKKLLEDAKLEVEDKGLYSFTRSPSGKAKKKVSFRLPEVSDIIILDSPEVDSKE